ncbi:MAG: hypothetical protein E6J06_08350 [Chloroflexi bacterium]|nr:MAG: hypothetical protein E6J06_08350 [Chloroflexota bacterium]
MRSLGVFPEPDGLSQLLLRLTVSSTREIARLTGYDSEVSVTKAFRRHFGVAPGAYRKANAAN